MRSQGSSDEELNQEEQSNSKPKEQSGENPNGKTHVSQSDSFWREKQRVSSSIKINAHVSIIANKSPYFFKLLKEK